MPSMTFQHVELPLKVLYFGTPVVLISSLNPDGSTNVAPMSSAWWLGQEAMVGMGNASQTAKNLLREPDCVLNLAQSDLAGHVDQLALLSGASDMPARKTSMGYRYEPDKFATSGLTPSPSLSVRPDRVAECQIQLEGRVVGVHPFTGPTINATAFHIRVGRVHVAEHLIVPETAYVDPQLWDPLIMKFCEFFGNAENVFQSRLARAWQIPRNHALEVTTAVG